MNEILSSSPKRNKIAFSVIRVPFFLEPYYDENKPYIESNRERLIQKWGGKQGWEEQKLRHDLKGRGQAAGIPYFNLDRLAANTMSSHRLIQYIGKTYGLDVSESIYDLLNIYYFVDGYSLNDRPKLANVVSNKLQQLLLAKKEKNGLNDETIVIPTENDILNFLNGNEGRAEIEHALQTLQELGIHGIPKFIIDGQTIVDGAASSEVFVRIFRNIQKRGSVSGQTIFGNILGIPPHIITNGSHL